MLRYCGDLKAIRYESTSLNRIVVDKSHGVIVAIARFFHFSLETEFNASRFINYTIPRLCSTYAVATWAGNPIAREVWVEMSRF